MFLSIAVCVEDVSFVVPVRILSLCVQWVHVGRAIAPFLPFALGSYELQIS